MDYLTILLFISFALACLHFLNSNLVRRTSSRLPPGPFPLPIVGNIFQIGQKPHQSLANLSKKYGPLMTLKLGRVTTVVVSSPDLAKEVLQKHDRSFSSRSIPDVAHVLDHDKFSLVWLPADATWRTLRQICKEQLFSSHSLHATHFLRREKLQDLVGYVKECSRNGEAVNISHAAFTTILNLMSNTIFSVDLAQYQSDSSHKFKAVVCALLELGGKPNLVDSFPILRSVDPQGLRRQTEYYFNKLFEIFDDITNQRLQSRASSPTSSPNNDVLEALLDLNQENDTELSYNHIKHLLLDLFVAGTDTSASTVEWAMTELLCNPDKMAKARSELEQVLGKDMLVQETDIPRLPYLQAVVKEILRLHPPVPFLVPRKADADTEIQGFVVPTNAQILFNVWAIGRDSNIWPNPDSFLPERFLESNIDFRGHYFELIPFGAGRRICLGLPLANQMIHLILASLLHSFMWKVEEEVRSEQMHESDKFRLILQKAIPLKAIPIAM